MLGQSRSAISIGFRPAGLEGWRMKFGTSKLAWRIPMESVRWFRVHVAMCAIVSFVVCARRGGEDNVDHPLRYRLGEIRNVGGAYRFVTGGQTSLHKAR